MKMFALIPAACVLVAGMWPAESRAEFNHEPVAGDFVNESAQRVMILGDDVLGPGTDYVRACQLAHTSSHDWGTANDIDFFYDPATDKWCKIGPWEGKRFANGAWHWPEAWQTPAQVGQPGGPC